jgi:gliding motility-associated-like protein
MNTKKLGCFLVLIFISLINNAQSYTWVNEAYGPPFASVGETMFDHYMAIDRQGNYYVTGSLTGPLTFNGVTLSLSPGYMSFFLNKYDANGNMLWAKKEGDTTYDGYPMSLATDDSGNIFVCGYFQGRMVCGNDTLTSQLNSQDGFLVKFDRNGNPLWMRQNGDMDSNSKSWMSSVVTDNAGNLYVTGAFNDTIVFGPYTLKAYGAWYNEAFVVKYDPAGNVLWAKQANMSSSASSSTGNSITSDPAKQYFYLAGSFADTVSFGGNAVMTGPTYEMYLAKYDANGNVIWVRQATVPMPNFNCNSDPYSVAVDGDNNIYVTGQFQDTVIFGNIQLQLPVGYGSIFLAKYNPAGNVIWAEKANINPGVEAFGYSIACDTLKRGGGYMTAETDVASGAGTMQSIGFGGDTSDYWGTIAADRVMIFDSSGKITCKLLLPTDEDDGSSVATDRAGVFQGVAGDLLRDSNATVGNNIQLHPGYDSPYIGRWKKCCPLINSNINSKPDTCNLLNGSATVNASGVSAPFSYYWFPSGGADSIAHLGTGTYVVIVTDSNGCAAFDTAIITSVNSLTAHACCDTTIPEGGSAIIGVDVQNYKYLWSPPVGLNCDTCQTPVASPTVITEYSVTVSKGSCRYLDSVLITVNNEPCGKFYIPNAFTPNKDNKNDLFYPEGDCLVSYTMDIFDRWGMLIYSTNNSEPWDGTYHGKVAEEDVYVYQINIISGEQPEHSFVGRVAVLK